MTSLALLAIASAALGIVGPCFVADSRWHGPIYYSGSAFSLASCALLLWALA